MKLNVRGQIGWPDQLFIYKGKVAFVEFKRPGEEPTVYQLHIHNKLRANGALVYVVDNYDAAKQTIDEIICA